MAEELPSRSLLSRFDACAPTSPELIFCNAINDKRIDEYGKMSDSTRAYLHRNFSDFGDKWRHKRCSFQILWDASSQALPTGWKRRHGWPTCPYCLSSIKNMSRDLKNLNEIKTKELGLLSLFMPSLYS